MRLAQQNLAMAERMLDAVAAAISGKDIPPDTHIALAGAYTALAAEQRKEENHA